MAEKQQVYFEVQQLRGHPDDKHELFWFGTGIASAHKDNVEYRFGEEKILHPNRIYRMVKVEVIG